MEVRLDIKDTNTLDFLKQFYERHCKNTDDNLCTYKPIHLVQSKEYTYAPYSSELINEWDWEVCFMEMGDYGVIRDEVEFLSYYFEIENAIPFEELEQVELEKGGNFVIFDYDDYFEYYGLEKSDYEILCRKHYWQTRAYFLIRQQAEEYKKYQKHNLGESRVYTDSSGYSNYGEWESFYDLLLSIGKDVYDNGNK